MAEIVCSTDYKLGMIGEHRLRVLTEITHADTGRSQLKIRPKWKRDHKMLERFSCN